MIKNKVNTLETADEGKGSLKGKKILSVYYKHKPGGFCKRLYMMFDALLAEGAKIHYISTEPYPKLNSEVKQHILWTPFNKKEGLFFWLYFICITPFYLLIVGRREKIDLVSVFGGVYGFLAIFLKLLLQKPIMIFVRADGFKVGESLGRPVFILFFEEFLSKIGFELSDQIITVNHHLKTIISLRHKIRKDKITVLSNHIEDLSQDILSKKDYRKKLTLDEEIFVVITVGVLDSRKNVDFLIRATSDLKEPLLLLIVGDGAEKQKLEKLANEVASNARIIFTGWQEDVLSFLKASDLFVLPSKHEGCSNALLEALACGISSLGSDTPENREVLEDEKLLFDPLDVNSFSDKLERMLVDENFLTEIKVSTEKAREHLSFNWKEHIVKLHSSYLSL